MLNICAVVITKDPDPGLLDRMKELRESVEKIILVDNGSSHPSLETITQLEVGSWTEVIWNSENLGVATALNMGTRAAIEGGYEWILTLDQDSEPESDMVRELIRSYEKQISKSTIGMIAPRIVDARVDREALFLRASSKFLYERVRCEKQDLDHVATVITSGALINLACFTKVGGFREDLFIDYVDTDFCLRAKLLQYRILVSCRAKLKHQFGDRKEVRWGPVTLYPSFHSPERWYTISRNRIPMIKKFGLRFPFWLLYEFVASTYTFTRMLLTEDQKFKKVFACLKGSWDGLLGRLGPPPWNVKSKSL